MYVNRFRPFFCVKDMTWVVKCIVFSAWYFVKTLHLKRVNQLWRFCLFQMCYSMATEATIISWSNCCRTVAILPKGLPVRVIAFSVLFVPKFLITAFTSLFKCSISRSAGMYMYVSSRVIVHIYETVPKQFTRRRWKDEGSLKKHIEYLEWVISAVTPSKNWLIQVTPAPWNTIPISLTNCSSELEVKKPTLKNCLYDCWPNEKSTKESTTCWQILLRTAFR